MDAPVDLFARDALLAAPGNFLVAQRVRFQDVDAAGIIFFARLFDLVHDAYVAFLDRHGIRLADVLAAGTWAAPLGHAEADFLRPTRFGDELAVGPVRARLAGSRIEIGHRVELAGGGSPIAVARTVHVFVDRKTFKKIDAPADVAAAFAQLA